MRSGADIASARVQVAAPADAGSGSGNLSTTGVDLGWMPWALAVAILLIVSGIVVMGVRRRRAD